MLWLISPLQIYLHLRFWEWWSFLLLPQPLFAQLIVLLLFLSAHLYQWNDLVLSPFLPFSDHLTMRRTFHVALWDEKGKKLWGEGQRTEVSIWLIQSSLLADSDFAFQKYFSFPKIVVFMVRSISFFFPHGVMIQWFITTI